MELAFDLRGPDPATALADARRLRAAWEERVAGAARDFGTHPAQLIEQLSDVERQYFNARAVLAFPAQVAASADVRAAALDAERELNTFWSAHNARRDVLDAARSALAHAAAHGLALDEEDCFFLTRVAETAARNGAELGEAERARAAELRAEIQDCNATFQRNLREDSTALFFTREELDGLPDDFFASRAEGPDGRLRVTLAYPDLFPILKRARRPATRRALEQATHSRPCAAENAALLRRAANLRQELAGVLGRASHADLVAEECAAASRAFVLQFLADAAEATAPAARQELEGLLAMKRAEAGEGEEAGVLRPWDLVYYHHRSLAARGFDEEGLKRFFPLSAVLRGTLATYERLLAVRFEAAPAGSGPPELDALRWHPDVLLYSAWEAGPGGALIGHVLLDLFPRPGKFPHASGFPLRRACRAGGGWQRPVCAMVANLSRPAAGEARLKHGEILTLFHEFGHVMHSLLSRARFARFAGTAVEPDFVEAPAQMLEHWVWDPDVLLAMAAPPPGGTDEEAAAAVRAIAGARGANGALLARQRLATALFDQRVHGPGPLPAALAPLYAATLREVAWTDGGDEPPAVDRTSALLHLACGYDGSFFVYTIARAWAAAMLARFGRCPRCPLAGREWRTTVLEAGGSRPAGASLAAFLGEAPSPAALARSLAAGPDPALRRRAAARTWCRQCDACRCSCPCPCDPAPDTPP